MNYGDWLTRARGRLSDAAEELETTKPHAVADVLAVAASRGALYRQLARHIEMLVKPTEPTHEVARPEPNRASPLAALRYGLRSVANEAASPLPMLPAEAVSSLGAAADGLGAAADILASHIEANPRTLEGAAIRAGGGIASASRDLARVAFDALAVDRAVQHWLDVPDQALAAIGEPLAAAARRTTTGALPCLLGDVLAMAATGPALLHNLTLVPAVDARDELVSTAAAAATSMYAARAWLWQHPDRFRAVHLRLGTQLGLAAAILADGSSDSPRDWWRRAAGLAADIEGTAPTDDALAAAHRLADVLAWTRTALDCEPVPWVDQVAAQLPSMAETLLAGAISAVQRGDIFVNRATIRRHNTGVYRPECRWHRATPTAPEIVLLRDTLQAIHNSPEPAPPSAARRAFQTPPQPGATTIRPQSVLAAASTFRSGRTR
jgi:hypothetical protein